MFRLVVRQLGNVRGVTTPRTTSAVSQFTRGCSGTKETDEEFDQRFIKFFEKKDIDSWECRKAFNDIAGHDLVPDPKIIVAALRACRRLNDYALAVRFLECVKDKCGPKLKEFYPYILQEIRPTLDELGINTPEELGYDKPELALENVYEIH